MTIESFIQVVHKQRKHLSFAAIAVSVRRPKRVIFESGLGCNVTRLSLKKKYFGLGHTKLLVSRHLR